MIFFLGRAMARHPGIQLHAAVAMSNHLHFCLTDNAGKLSEFMCELLGPLAKALNAMDSVRGQFFERRYAATEIVDDAALFDRIVYTVTNPSAANLVNRVEDWEGLCAWQGGVTTLQGARFRERAYERAVRGSDAAVDRDLYVERVRVDVTPLVFDDKGRDATRELDLAIRARLETLAIDRQGAAVIGMAKVRATPVFSAPRRPKRTRMPLCHASKPELWRAFRNGWRHFVSSYRAASACFRRGEFSVLFPEHSFRPSMPLLA